MAFNRHPQKYSRGMNSAQRAAIWTTTYPEQVKEGQRERKDREQYWYAKEARQFKKENPICRICDMLRPGKKPYKTTDCHHTRGRQGALLRDFRHILPCCRYCHNWCGANVEAARALGLICDWGQWNKQPKL